MTTTREQGQPCPNCLKPVEVGQVVLPWDDHDPGEMHADCDRPYRTDHVQHPGCPAPCVLLGDPMRQVLLDRVATPGAGDAVKVRLGGERQRYTVMARNDRFLIMTKPFNAQRTYLYTIADLTRKVRGPCDLIFGLPCDVDTPHGAAEALAMIEDGKMGVSSRRCVDLTDADLAALQAPPASTEA